MFSSLCLWHVDLKLTTFSLRIEIHVGGEGSIFYVHENILDEGMAFPYAFGERWHYHNR